MIVERLPPGAWERLRAIRLRALASDPDTFGSTLDAEQRRPSEEWAARAADEQVATFVARLGGVDVGMAVGAPYRGRPGAAGLFGMWVAPEARGRGVGEALVESVVRWAAACGYARVVLDVGDENTPAIGLYERCGFDATGVVGKLPAPRGHITEHERARELGP